MRDNKAYRSRRRWRIAATEAKISILSFRKPDQSKQNNDMKHPLGLLANIRAN